MLLEISNFETRGVPYNFIFKKAFLHICSGKQSCLVCVVLCWTDIMVNGQEWPKMAQNEENGPKLPKNTHPQIKRKSALKLKSIYNEKCRKIVEKKAKIRCKNSGKRGSKIGPKIGSKIWAKMGKSRKLGVFEDFQPWTWETCMLGMNYRKYTKMIKMEQNDPKWTRMSKMDQNCHKNRNPNKMQKVR